MVEFWLLLVLAWIHRSISELNPIYAGQQAN
jgi:hypothetical protein